MKNEEHVDGKYAPGKDCTVHISAAFIVLHALFRSQSWASVKIRFGFRVRVRVKISVRCFARVRVRVGVEAAVRISKL